MADETDEEVDTQQPSAGRLAPLPFADGPEVGILNCSLLPRPSSFERYLIVWRNCNAWKAMHSRSHSKANA
eukprot:scaffold253693_cov43-Prasinocladus_malaysianus.AAC.1